MSSEVADEWASTTLKEAAGELFTDGDWVESKDQDPDGEVRLIQLADIGDGLFLDKSARFLTADKARELRCTFLRPGDLLIARMADPIARCCLFPGLDQPAATVVDVSIVRPGLDVDREYLAYAISNPAFRSEALGSASGTTRSRISRSNLGAISLPLPPLDEQRRIAEVLRSVDEALHTARDVADQCEQVLRVELDGIAARLFAEDVPQVKLGSVARVKGGKRLPKGSEYSDVPTGNPYIRVTDWQDYEIRTADLRYISDEIARAIWRYTISASDIFISIAGSVGLVATVPESLEGAYLTENAAKICINDTSTLDTTYLLALLRSGSLAEQIAKHKGVGGGVPKLALFRIEDLDIPVPNISVQIEIGETYRSLRAGVEAARAAVGQLEATRKEVMSDLLSGRVRVPA